MTFSPESVDLLIVDNDAEFRGTVARRFLRRGFQVCEASGGNEALKLAEGRQFDVAIVDLMMPEMSGLELLGKLKESHSDCEVLLLTGQGSIETAVEAMKNGAYDYLTKPFPLTELEVLTQRAYERRLLRKENKQLKAALERQQAIPEIVGQSPAMMELFRLIERAGRTDKAILIQGESGTGKELVARALHKSSSRADKPLVVINCAALAETLLESELFGHEKGAFTGAVASKHGLFELADGGTLFIDEIGEMPGPLQAKLLRVLEDGSMRRVGSLKEQRVHVRILAASNRDMAEEVHAGRFREDLFYRINVMSLELPPLRERRQDIRLLVAKFLGEDWEIEQDALEMLERYTWPGNVRQLINVLERAKILSDSDTIQTDDLPQELIKVASSPALVDGATPDELSAVQRAHVADVLVRENWNKARAAKALGINRRSLYRLIEKYEL